MAEEAGEQYAGPDQWLSLDVIYDAALKELEAQLKDSDKADDRLRLLIGFVGLVSTALAAVGGITGAVPEDRTLTLYALQLTAGAGLVLLIVAGAIAVWGYNPRDFHRPPYIPGLRNDYLTQPEAETKLAIVDELVTDFDKKGPDRL